MDSLRVLPGHASSARPVVLLLAGLLALTGCGSANVAEAPGRDPAPAASAAPAATAEPARESAAPAPASVTLPEAWVTEGFRRDGEGYVLSMTPTSEPDLFDGQFQRLAVDGSVEGLKFITVRVTSPDAVEVTWPDGSIGTGGLELETAGGAQTLIDLGPGCAAFLVAGASRMDCILTPAVADDVPPEPSTAPTPSPSPVSTTGTDEAMGYLCSVDVADLPDVTRASADPFATSVLQVALTQLGYEPGPADGDYRAGTRRAVRAYQSDVGLVVDAQVGPRTWTSLQADACRVAEDPAQ